MGSSLQLTGTPLLAHSLAKAATMEHIGYASLLRLHMSFLHMVMNLLNSIFALQSLKIGLLIAAGQVLSARSEALNENILMKIVLYLPRFSDYIYTYVYLHVCRSHKYRSSKTKTICLTELLIYCTNIINNYIHL